MGEYNAKCALTGLPIEIGDSAKVIFLRECKSFETRDTYWVPTLYSSWKPLLFPVTGRYQGYGWIDNYKKGIETKLLMNYFSQENIFKARYNEEPLTHKFTFKKDNFEDMTDRLIEDTPVYKLHYAGDNTLLKHSYCLVNESAYNFALSLFEKDRETYREIYESSLADYLCPFTELGLGMIIRHKLSNIFTEADLDNLKYDDIPKAYFERKGVPINQDSSYSLEDKIAHARCLDGNSDHFLYEIDKAIAGSKPAYILSTENEENKEHLINLMIDSILLHQFTRYWGIQHVWEPLRTFSKYKPRWEEIHYPWTKFKLELAQSKLDKWLEYEREFEEYD